MPTTIAWLRNDLRTADNPALDAAIRSGGRTICLYVHEDTPGVRPPGAAARWWLHHSLVALERELAAVGIELLVRSGNSREIIDTVVDETDTAAVFWNRRYAAGERAVDAAIKAGLRDRGIGAESFAGNLLIEPWEISTGQGKPYSVFTPFWKNLRTLSIAAPLRPAAGGHTRNTVGVDGDYNQPEWAHKLAPYWSIGETAAKQALADFLDDQLDDYPAGRDFPAKNATSRLSPHLRFGEISARQVWHAATAIAHADHRRQPAIDKFLSELAWRDFSYHQLYHRADIATEPMQAKYRTLNWRSSEKDISAWQRGRTGLPIIDAGMRELWASGFMQNRVRMLVASLLTKNLLIDWRKGEQWFWDCLVDGDVANNPASWQWVAGCGLDAAPYFRIFNPITQGEKFDATGAYVREWVPELSRLPDEWIHRPSEAPEDVLAKAGVVLGKSYPRPIIDLRASRVRALEAVSALTAE